MSARYYIYGISFFLLCTLFSLRAIAQDDPPPEDTTVVYQEEDTEDTNDTEASDSDEEDLDQFWLKEEYDEDDDRVVMRQVPADRIKKMKEDKDFWYADLERQKEKEEKNTKYREPFFSKEWVQALLWIIIVGGFAAFLIIYLSGSKVGLFRRKSGSIKDDEDIGVTEDIFAINYQKEIDKAVQGGNYRLAIRLMFLRILKKLSDKNVIDYKQERTNLDYLMQLQPTTYYTEFFRLTRNYEYSWYGLFDINDEIYGRIQKDFQHFEKQIDR